MTDGPIVRRNAGTGGSGTAFVPYVCGSDGSARRTEQTSRYNHPTCTGTVSRLFDRIIPRLASIQYNFSVSQMRDE